MKIIDQSNKRSSSLQKYTIVCMLFIGTLVSTSYGQDICVSMLNNKIIQLEKGLTELESKTKESYGLKGDLSAFNEELEQLSNDIENCENNDPGDLSDIKSKATNIIDKFSALETTLTATEQQNMGYKILVLQKMDNYIFNFGTGSVKQQDMDAISRADIEFLATYPIDESPYYKNNIERGLKAYSDLQTRFNGEEFQKSARYHINDAANMKDRDSALKKLENMESALLYWQKVFFPNNKKMIELLSLLEAAK